LGLLALAPVPAFAAQSSADRDRAALQNRLGWEQMRVEHWAEAAKYFQQAIDIDPRFKYAYYGLGRANLALKRYVESIAALERCRGLYQEEAGRKFASAQDAQRFRQDRLLEIDEQIRFEQVARPQNSQRGQDTMRQLQLARQNVQESLRRGNDIAIENTIPPWVSLSLGSAYFRASRMADAERAYKETIASDPKSGEAYSNLAVVFLETGRYADAEDAVKSAKKVGFKVHPQLEQDIKDRRKGS